MKTLWFLCNVIILLSLFPAHALPKKKTWSFHPFKSTPLQNGGRFKPLDSFAREVILFETGRRSFQHWEPVDLLLSWMAYPEEWEKEPLIFIENKQLRIFLNLDPKIPFFSVKELLSRHSVIEDLSLGKPDALATEKKHLLDQLTLFQGIVSGRQWTLIPDEKNIFWQSIIEPGSSSRQIEKIYLSLLAAYQKNDSFYFQHFSHLLFQSVTASLPREQIHRLSAEVFFHSLRPFFSAWILYLFSAVFLCFSLLDPRTSRQKTIWTVFRSLGFCFFTLGFILHISGFVLRCFITQRPPVTNMYESMIWVSLGVIFFSSLLFYYFKEKRVLIFGACLAVLGLIAADLSPSVLDSSLNPLPPVLRNNYWLTVHVLTITLSYAAFTLSFGLANYSLWLFMKKAPLSQITLITHLLYRCLQYGIVLIAAGTFLGGVWADYSWGRFWGWDPKEVWALITLLSYIALLHGRLSRWLTPFWFSVGAAFSFLSVLMAWYGVNFILGIGLHSYGFSQGGTEWVTGAVFLELAYILWCIIRTGKERHLLGWNHFSF